MKIYIELIFIINFLLDFMILYGVKHLLKRKINNYRLVLGSLFGSFTILILFIKVSTIELFILKIILSIFIILISFGIKNIYQNILYFYLISIIIGGFIYLFDLQNNKFYLLLLIFLTPIFLYLIIKELIQIKINYKDKYQVTIIINNKKYNLDGFIDTGNRLIDNISNKSIILTNLNIKYKEVIYVPYKALNTEGIIPCIKPDKVIIEEKEFNNYLIGLSKDKFNIKNIDCILPNKLKEDLCI